MRSFSRLIYFAALTSILVILILVGCGKEKQTAEMPTTPGRDDTDRSES